MVLAEVPVETHQLKHTRCVVLYERVEGGSAAVIALIGESKILLIRDRSRRDPKWKLIAETVKPGESILHTVFAGLTEEAGMTGIRTELGQDGKVIRFVDPRIKQVVEFGRREWIENAKLKHWRHFFGVLTTDEEIHKLSGDNNLVEEEGEMEDIETMEFPLAILDTIPNLLRQHAELIRSIPLRQRIPVC